MGYTPVSYFPTDANLKVSSQSQSVGKIYYKRDLSTKWQFAEYQETLTSAQARAKGETTVPVYALVTGFPVDKYDPTDSVIDLKSPEIISKYTAAGFTYSGASLGTPTTPAPEAGVEEMTVTGDGTARGNVYYLRKLDCTYKVEYYLQNLSLTGYTLDSTLDNQKGIAGSTVNTEPGLTGTVYKAYPGFTYDKTQTKPEVNPTLGLTTTIQLYYTRNTDVK